jgi:aminomethyltransferase
MEAGQEFGVKPAGLGARDTLRLEAKMCLYGNDITDETTPLEAGLNWTVKLDGPDFLGREALRKQKAEGIKRKLVGFVMKGRGIARHEYPIHAPGAAAGTAGERIGTVTSGSPAPTLNANIGMGYVPTAQAQPGQLLMIDCRGKFVEAEIVKGAFYKRSY